MLPWLDSLKRGGKARGFRKEVRHCPPRFFRSERVRLFNLHFIIARTLPIHDHPCHRRLRRQSNHRLQQRRDRALFIVSGRLDGYFPVDRERSFCRSQNEMGGDINCRLLVIDMARANAPWVRYYDYRQKYASNAVIDFLASKAYEHRVATRLTPMGQVYLSIPKDLFPGLMNEWMQHLFQYYNLHSLDIIQWPRMPEFDRAYLNKFLPASNEDLTGPGRILQLSNTRFLLGMRGFLPALNQAVDPMVNPFAFIPVSMYSQARNLGTQRVRRPYYR